MTKQEEIREEVARTFYEESDIRKTIGWLDLPEETRGSFFYKADNLLFRLHSQHGVVLKVDRELPKNPIKVTNAFGMSDKEVRERNLENDLLFNITQANMLDAGYVVVEPLVEEK